MEISVVFAKVVSVAVNLAGFHVDYRYSVSLLCLVCIYHPQTPCLMLNSKGQAVPLCLLFDGWNS